MAGSGPRETDAADSDTNGISRYSTVRGFFLYFGACFFLWFFVAPFIAPTDVRPAGAQPVPLYLIVIQLFLCYGGPLVIVWLDRRRPWIRYASTA